jgi:ABC-type multidrug transport system fused ATPase/permease subunit
MPVADDAPLLRTYLRPHRRALAVVVVGLLAATALPLLGPQLLRRFVDQAAAGAPLPILVGTATAYLAVALAGQGVRVGTAWAGARFAWRSTNRLREDLAAHVLGLDLAFHGRHTPGELIERIDGDVFRLGEFLSRFLLQVVGSALLLFGAVVLVWREDARVGSAHVSRAAPPVAGGEPGRGGSSVGSQLR